MSSDKVLFRYESIHGTGEPVYFVWQTSGMFLATTGSDGTVAIFNRQGQLLERLILQGLCCGLAWDTDGDLLGIITGSAQLTLWDSNSRKKQIVDIGLRDSPSFLVWSKKTQLLAVGTSRGNLAIYNHHTTRRIPILGKHSKRITCGAWSNEGILALGSEDKTLSLSNEDGDSLKTIQLRDIPSDMNFAEMKTDERVPGENTLSMILGNRTLYLYHLPEPDSPTELGFQHKYGSLIQHKWFGDGYVLLGFAMGYIVAISTHPREVGQELWQVKNHRDSLSAIAVCTEMQLIASCGDNNIKIHSMSNLQETVKVLNLSDQAGVKNIDWSSDGQLLAATTTQGAINVFITQLYSLFAICPTKIAILSSLAEVSLYQFTDKIKQLPNVITLEIEPSFLAVGPFHLACGMNNHIWFYDLGKSVTDTALLIGDREYVAEIKEVILNGDYCAILHGGCIMLHSIETHNQKIKNHEPKLFPDENGGGAQESIITCLGLTSDFLAFATDLGHLIYFSLHQWSNITSYRHMMGIKNIYMDLDGTKMIFIDDHNQGYVYTSMTEHEILIPDFPKAHKGVIWDSSNQSNVFLIFDNKICSTYIFIRKSIIGEHVKKVGETQLVSEQIPLICNDGQLCLYATGGKINTITLTTHLNNPGMGPKEHLEILKNLRKYSECWEICKILNDDEEWRELGNLAISDLDIEFAMRIFRKIGDAGMVLSLNEFKNVEDLNLLSGYCCVLLGKNDEAKIFFAKSIFPEEALELCRNLLECEQALNLAGSLAPEQVPFIAREYAQQLEFNGNYSEALFHYEKGLRDNVGGNLSEHVKLCKGGLARTCIKTGDYRKGINLALELNEKQLLQECGESLIQFGHISEAAQLLEKAECWESACNLYIQLKSWNKVEQILPQVTSLKLHSIYAKAKESEGRFKEAIKSYTFANDLDSVVRIYLDYLSDAYSASEIVIETKSPEGAKMLARFYQQIGDYESTLRFLILCGCVSDAFILAQKQNKLKFYGELLEQSDTKPSDYLTLAQYFESEKYTLLAGKYYFLAKEYSKSLKFLLKASAFSNEENSALSIAIDCVATSNDEKLATELIEFLLGESDGIPKDPKLLFRLYMARKQFNDAAKVAVIIANQEQTDGNYRSAHNLLFSMYQELKRNQLSIASNMRYSLVLLHRYILVRFHIKRGEHLKAAKLLVQVAANISQFPSHTVPLLTTTVIECNRAGLKKNAFNYAVILMRSEFRSKIDAKYSKKIESIVRRSPKEIKGIDEDNLGSSNCPICDVNLPAMEINCYQCKTTLPICIATGEHIKKDGIAVCPECDFLCVKSEMTNILNESNQCPMCEEIVDSNRLVDVEDIVSFIGDNLRIL